MIAASPDALVRAFARLLAAAWPEVQALAPRAVADWLQSQWEMFVEGALPPGTILESYGEGADCNARSSRVYRPDAISTHRMVCSPRGATVIDRLSGRAMAGMWPLDELVTLDGAWYASRPPFDCVLVESGPYVFHLDDVVFSLAPVPLVHA